MTPRTQRPNPRRRLDLKDAWQAERERVSSSPQTHQPWCRGHGWMLRDGLADILAPITYGDEFGEASFYRFASLDADVAARLLDTLDEEYLATARQNDGPTIGAVLLAVVRNPDRLRAHGYVIGPGRCDERITVEGILARTDREYRLCNVYGEKLGDCQCEELYAWLCDEFDLDAQRFPHELDKWLGYGWGVDGYAGETWYRAWWD